MPQRKLLQSAPLLSLLTVLALAGCAAGGQPQAADTQSTAAAAASVTSSAPAEASQTATASDAEVCQWSSMRVGLITRSWDSVTASKDASDHRDMLDDFKEILDEAADSDDVPGCEGAVELAQLNYETAKLAVPVLLGDATAEDYEMVAEAGNKWLKAIGRTDYEFQPSYDG